MGLVEWNTTGIDQPTNSGWPYCTGNNFNYNEWNYETSTPREFFDCGAGARNNSRWNTGLATLPPAVPADLYYGDKAADQPWPELTDFEAAGGQGPMGGPVYHYDAENPSTTKFPQYWDNKAFFAEFSQDYLAAFTVNWPDGPVEHIEHFLPNAELTSHAQPITDSPIDIEFGPDGSLYVLDYGDGFFRANPDAGLYRIDYTPGNKAPQPKISADPISGSSAPLTVKFDASGSTDPEGGALTYEWDFDGNGTFDATGATASHTYTALGAYTARLRVTDPEGRRGLTSTTISVGNVAPTVTVGTPANGSFFTWGDAVPFTVTTSDPEDGTATTCSRVAWTFGLGHDAHAHPLSQGTGCTFTIPTPADAQEHGVTENIFGVVVIRYTDNAVNGVPAAVGEVSMILNPREQQAEWADSRQGVEVVDDADASGLRKVTSLDPGDHLAWDPVNLNGIGEIRVRASGQGTLALRWNSAGSAPFATVPVDSEGWSTIDRTLVDPPTGTGELFVTSTGGVVVDSLIFGGDGVVDTTAPAVTVGGLTADAALGDSGTLKPTWSATDASGIESLTATLDGAPVAAGSTVELWKLPLGSHTLAVKATDKAGVSTTKSVAFSTVTSFQDVGTWSSSSARPRR